MLTRYPAWRKAKPDETPGQLTPELRTTVKHLFICRGRFWTPWYTRSIGQSVVLAHNPAQMQDEVKSTVEIRTCTNCKRQEMRRG